MYGAPLTSTARRLAISIKRRRVKVRKKDSARALFSQLSPIAVPFHEFFCRSVRYRVHCGKENGVGLDVAFSLAVEPSDLYLREFRNHLHFY